MIAIEALFFFLSGTWTKFLIEILFLENIFVIEDKTPGKSFTSTLKYDEQDLLYKSNFFIFFLFEKETPNGNFISPLSIEHKSEIKEEVVGPGPAPSPCKTVLPTGEPSITTAFNTPFIFAI